MVGTATALKEISLVVFTTLAPSGICACAFISLLIFAGAKTLKAKDSDKLKVRLCHFHVIPMVLSMIGLIAAATHLGTPANAFFVLDGIGRSPLSNEVFCTVLFLGIAGVTWMVSFMEKAPLRLLSVLHALLFVLAWVSLYSIAVAYSESSIITWNSALTPVALVLEGVSGGVILLLMLVNLVEAEFVSRKVPTAVLVAGAVVFLASVVVLAVQCVQFWAIENTAITFVELAGAYPYLLGGYALLGAGAYVVTGVSLARGERRNRCYLGASALFLVGCFCARFGFYMAHMTVGISF